MEIISVSMRRFSKLGNKPTVIVHGMTLTYYPCGNLLKEKKMLIELRDVEVYIEPDEILKKALEEGDLSVDKVVRACIYEENAEAVLDAVEHCDIEHYCKRHDIGTTVVDFETIASALRNLTQLEKAQLLWLLLKCEG
jgi:hypothetical protein